MKQLRKNLKIDAQILKDIVINEETDVPLLNEHVVKADVILLYKPHLGLGNCIAKICEFGLPVILFNDEGMVNNPLDALEYVYPREKVWVAVDYQDLNNYLGALSVKKKLGQTKILILNANYPHWERFICRVHGAEKPSKRNLE